MASRNKIHGGVGFHLAEPLTPGIPNAVWAHWLDQLWRVAEASEPLNEPLKPIQFADIFPHIYPNADSRSLTDRLCSHNSALLLTLHNRVEPGRDEPGWLNRLFDT